MPMTQSKPPSKPPSKEEMEQARKELDEACVAVEAASKKHEKAAAGLKRTVSDPQFRAVKLPTPSQLDLEVEPLPEKR